MVTSKLFKSEIIRRGKAGSKKGYYLDNSTNLIEGVTPCLFFDDMMQGGGGELKSKFNAVYSSAALCVNNFAVLKKHINQFSFKGIRGFTCANFERKFGTGLHGASPNLDFAIENEDTLIAFESKYLETLEKKKAKFSESYNQKKLAYLNGSPLIALIDKYKGKEMFLDVAQLIKHSIGLINYGKQHEKKARLVYIYWKPKNSGVLKQCYEEHDNELKAFDDELKGEKNLHFSSMTYNKFWEDYTSADVFSEHFDKVRARYDIEITLP